MKYPDKPCDKDCTLDEAHDDEYNPMYDPWGHFWYELVPYIVTKAAPPPGPPAFLLRSIDALEPRSGGRNENECSK